MLRKLFESIQCMYDARRHDKLQREFDLRDPSPARSKPRRAVGHSWACVVPSVLRGWGARGKTYRKVQSARVLRKPWSHERLWRTRYGIAGTVVCMSLLVAACSDKDGSWYRVTIISVEGTVVCMQPVNKGYRQDFPPNGIGCRDGSRIDLSRITPGTCVMLKIVDSPTGRISKSGETC